MADTALVTGASSGIGEQFARQLAERGYDLILVARRKDRLEKLADELPSTAHVVECDLANEADKLFGKVSKLGVDVDLLVNNAGFGIRGRFLEIDPEREAEMVRVNCEAVVVLTRAFLPAMVERGRGGVITVASTAGMQPLPYEATYSASKAFAGTFMDALHVELKGTGVKAMSVNPGPVPTEWQEVAKIPEKSIPPGAISAEECVAERLRAYDRGRSRSSRPVFLIRQMLRFQRTRLRGRSAARGRSACTARPVVGRTAEPAARSCTCAWCSSVSPIARSAAGAAPVAGLGASASGRPSASTRNVCASRRAETPPSQLAQTTPPAAPEKPARCSASPQRAQAASSGENPAASASLARKASAVAGRAAESPLGGSSSSAR